MSTVARLTIAQYEKMIDSGVFDQERRIELIRGELREMSPLGIPHEYSVDVLATWSHDNTPRDRVWVRIQNSIALDQIGTVPQPDIVWLALGDYSSRRPRPADVLLIIEVSDSSLAYDRDEKASLYAQAAIQDYWIVNIPDRCVEVRRRPIDTVYQNVRVYGEHESVRPLRLPELSFPVSVLFGT
ncbi:MAG TPA: Uma2 family endonuclease [Pirellulaceae bacterium]|nr:Uma2 family endonuclease [Planctomycetaceae bacterium]HRX81392.1 Uma2 family endonuclease [Pirellulaceae bacterium]